LAHDIRNLLASLQLNAERLQASEGARERKLGTSLEGSIQQAMTLVDWAAMYTSTKRKISMSVISRLARLSMRQ